MRPKLRQNIKPYLFKEHRSELYTLRNKNDVLNDQLAQIITLSEQLKKSEERFRKFFEEDLTGDFLCNSEGVVLDCNEAFLQIYGLQDKSEIVDHKITTLYENEDDFEVLKNNLRQHKIIKNQEARRIKKTGEQIDILMNMVAELDSLGEIHEIKGYLYDITARKKLETELRVAKERAEESDRLKSAFLANMSHEIRTPMNAIVGFASFLKNPELTPDQLHTYSEIIIKSSNHLLTLLNDIIDISKIEAKQVKVVKSIVDVNALMLEMYLFFHSQLVAREKKNVVLKYCLSKKQFFIFSDEIRLRQILINLIGNAVKFTHSGHVEIGYRLEDQRLVFYVEDTGIGIPESSRQIIFNRFTQASPNTERLYGGTGLGLHITKACVDLLGGEIWLDSEEGKGSTFYVAIALEEMEKPEGITQIMSIENLRFKGENIVLAEDDEISFQYILEIFKPYNLNLNHFKDGKSVIDFVKQHPETDLLLLDIQLPGKNGWEITRTLRKSGFKKPIIIQTAYAYDSDRLESLIAGCDAFFAKPVKAGELLCSIYRLLYESPSKK